MKKIILFAAIILTAVSCSSKSSGTSTLSGTTWESKDGKISVSFTETTITLTDSVLGSSSSSYSVTTSSPDVAVYFNITNLKSGSYEYTTGAAYTGNKTLVLMGPLGSSTPSLYCYKK